MTREGVIWIKFVPSKRSRPQVGKSGGNPSPRKDRADSVIMAFAIPSVAETIIGLRILGSMWRNTIRWRRVPILCAAVTNSRSLMLKTSPRTIRAVCIQLVTPMMTTIKRKIPCSGPNIARNGSRNNMILTSRSGRSGNERNISVKRISGPSRDLTNPATTPISVPRNSAIKAADRPTASETWPPASICANVSWPMLSVPRGWAQTGPRFLALKSIACGSPP